MKLRPVKTPKNLYKSLEFIGQSTRGLWSGDADKIGARMDRDWGGQESSLGADLEQRANEVAELQKIVADKDVKLGEAQKVQAELMRKQRELDDARRELDVTVEKKVQESLVAVRHKAKQEAEDSLKLKVTEKEEPISSMQRQIEKLRRRAEQGSQQLQGEAFEIELEAVLRAKFPRDIIEPVPKGEFGGDVLHRVVGPSGHVCGTILWESKPTKNWSDTWLPKLREDQRTAKAEIARIVSWLRTH